MLVRRYFDVATHLPVTKRTWQAKVLQLSSISSSSLMALVRRAGFLYDGHAAHPLAIHLVGSTVTS